MILLLRQITHSSFLLQHFTRSNSFITVDYTWWFFYYSRLHLAILLLQQIRLNDYDYTKQFFYYSRLHIAILLLQQMTQSDSIITADYA